MLNVSATTQPNDVDDDRPGRPGSVPGRGRWIRWIQQAQRRLPERLQMRLDMARGRRIELNLTRSQKVKFNVKRRRDEDDDDDVSRRQSRRDRVIVSERGRVSDWSDSANEVNN